MAKSTNKRKNGKAVKPNRHKRLKALASYDLKHLMLCNVVDREELDGQSKMTPRTLVFSTKTKSPVNVTPMIKSAIKAEKWRWEVLYGVVCRNPDGTVYLDKEHNFVCSNEYKLTDLNDEITERLLNAFERANKLHRLTTFWVAAPIEQDSIPLEAVLAPIWRYNVLGNMLTAWEQENDDHVVLHYRTDKLMEFGQWFIQQHKHRQELAMKREVTFYFEPTGTKMLKGELTCYRDKIASALIGMGQVEFKPHASVIGFTKDKPTWTVCGDGLAVSKLMTALGENPPCVNCVVCTKYEDGRENEVRFVHNDVEFLKG